MGPSSSSAFTTTANMVGVEDKDTSSVVSPCPFHIVAPVMVGVPWEPFSCSSQGGPMSCSMPKMNHGPLPPPLARPAPW